jgi:hypothetical protein
MIVILVQTIAAAVALMVSTVAFLRSHTELAAVEATAGSVTTLSMRLNGTRVFHSSSRRVTDL